jgi:hypothetical protein
MAFTIIGTAGVAAPGQINYVTTRYCILFNTGADEFQEATVHLPGTHTPAQPG